MSENVKKFTEYCDEHDLRITPPRICAFEIIHKTNKPITAYEVLEEMGKTLKSPKPPTAYRALDFLAEHGFIHRIESLNAYVSCDVSHKHNGSQFMICDTCGLVEEIHLCHLPAKLEDKVSAEGFILSHWNVEVHGVCARCSN
ncbi:MAG: Fur family transcriptional regulator [Alphaproteobacteria bacterium]